jgi:hypothetical protein
MSEEILRPNAQGDYTYIPSQFPASGLHWDKVISNDYGNTVVYILNQTTQQKDAYNLGASSIPGGTVINWLEVFYTGFNGDTLEPAYLQAFLRLAGSESAGEEFQLSSTWTTYYSGKLSRPGGGGWTTDDLANLQVAIGLRTSDSISTTIKQCTEVYVRITYGLTIPTVITQAATNVKASSCTGNGNITAIGGAFCTRRGFCYMVGTSGDPTTADSVAYDDGSFGTGAYTKSITGLSPGTSYRVRTYAVNLIGTGYGTTVQILTTEGIGFHSATTQNRYKAATFSTFTFPDPAGTGFTAATDGYSMLAGWGILGAFQMLLSGTLYSTGVLGRKISKTLGGTLTSTGTLSASLRFLKVLYGTLNSSGTLVGKRVMLLVGTLNLSGSLNRLIKKGLSGTLNSVGGLMSKRFKVLTGTLNLSGTLATVNKFSKALAGTLNLSGSLIKLVKKNLIGVLNSSDTLGRKIFKKLSGTLNSSGALSYGMGLVHKALAGTLNLSGSLNVKIRKSLSGTLGFIGTLLSHFVEPLFYKRKYQLEVRDSAGNLLGILKNAFGISLEETTNAPTRLSFKLPGDDDNLTLITRANEIWVRDVKTNTVIFTTKLQRKEDTR